MSIAYINAIEAINNNSEYVYTFINSSNFSLLTDTEKQTIINFACLLSENFQIIFSL